MIVVKIELWPHGLRAKKREIGRVVIANDATGDLNRGNYDCALSHAGVYAERRGAWKSGRVANHLRSLSPYHLLLRALESSLLHGDRSQRGDELVESTKDGHQTPGERTIAEMAAKILHPTPPSTPEY